MALTFSDWSHYTDDDGNARTLDWSSDAAVRGGPIRPYLAAVAAALDERLRVAGTGVDLSIWEVAYTAAHIGSGEWSRCAGLAPVNNTIIYAIDLYVGRLLHPSTSGYSRFASYWNGPDFSGGISPPTGSAYYSTVAAPIDQSVWLAHSGDASRLYAVPGFVYMSPIEIYPFSWLTGHLPSAAWVRQMKRTLDDLRWVIVPGTGFYPQTVYQRSVDVSGYATPALARAACEAAWAAAADTGSLITDGMSGGGIIPGNQYEQMSFAQIGQTGGTYSCGVRACRGKLMGGGVADYAAQCDFYVGSPAYHFMTGYPNPCVYSPGNLAGVLPATERQDAFLATVAKPAGVTSYETAFGETAICPTVGLPGSPVVDTVYGFRIGGIHASGGAHSCYSVVRYDVAGGFTFVT
jgi:hypothetical protein